MRKRWYHRLIEWIRYGPLPEPRHTEWERYRMQLDPIAMPQVLHLPTGQWREQYFAEHPHLRKPPVRSLRRVELVSDDSWLNSGPPVRDTEPTETMPAVKMQALHPRRERV